MEPSTLELVFKLPDSKPGWEKFKMSRYSMGPTLQPGGLKPKPVGHPAGSRPYTPKPA
jgi:hypothetical protein